MAQRMVQGPGRGHGRVWLHTTLVPSPAASRPQWPPVPSPPTHSLLAPHSTYLYLFVFSQIHIYMYLKPLLPATVFAGIAHLYSHGHQVDE